MDMTLRGLGFHKPIPRVITRKRQEKLDAKAERECRRRVQQRDKGRCVVPGCITRGVMHMHHIVYRSQSKRLRWATANNCLLCQAHHRLEHASTIQISGNADEELIIAGDVHALRFRL